MIAQPVGEPLAEHGAIASIFDPHLRSRAEERQELEDGGDGLTERPLPADQGAVHAELLEARFLTDEKPQVLDPFDACRLLHEAKALARRDQGFGIAESVGGYLHPLEQPFDACAAVVEKRDDRPQPGDPRQSDARACHLGLLHAVCIDRVPLNSERTQEG